MKLKRFNLVFPMLAVVLMLSLFGCGGADSKPTAIPVTPQLLPPTVAPTAIPVTPQLFISTLAWGTTGTGAGQLDFPDGVAVAPDGGVYVADGLNSRIQKFTSEGVFVNKWGTQPAFYSEYNPDGGDGRFYYPKDVAVASDGSVYVSDTGNARIQKFTSEGVFVSKWGTRGTGDGELSNPNGVAVASDGSVYVVDDANSRIQKFTSEGAFLTKWGISSIGSYPAGDGQFEEPEGISVASDGSVYVADTRNYRIQKFTSEGVFVSKIEGSTWGTGDGQFQSPSGVAVSSDGSVYVADSGNNRIQKFSVGQ